MAPDKSRILYAAAGMQIDLCARADGVWMGFRDTAKHSAAFNLTAACATIDEDAKAVIRRVLRAALGVSTEANHEPGQGTA